jgi:hypothetical protein
LNTESLYLAFPDDCEENNAIIYLTDIFGVQLLNNRLYVSSVDAQTMPLLMPLVDSRTVSPKQATS